MFNVIIVKSFPSNEWALKAHNRWMKGRIFDGYANAFTPHLEWGLSSEGDLCCRGSFGYCNYPDWSPYEFCVFSIPLSEMKKIVKEFGHLAVFA